MRLSTDFSFVAPLWCPAAAVLGGAAFPGGSRASEQTQCSAFHLTTPMHGHFIACQRQSA